MRTTARQVKQAKHTTRQRTQRHLSTLVLVLGLVALLAACGPGSTSSAQTSPAEQACHSQGLSAGYQPGDAMMGNPYLTCVLTTLIGEVDAGTATVAYLVETFKNRNPPGQTTVAGWTLYAQSPTNPRVTATPGKYTGVGATAPLYTGNNPTQKGCFNGVTGVIGKLTGVTLPANLTLAQLKDGVLLFNEGSAIYGVSPVQHPSLVVSISEHLSSCPCDYQRLTLLPNDPAFLGTASAPGRVAQEARLVYIL